VVGIMNCQQEKAYEVIQKTPLGFEVKEPGTKKVRE
jgi:hypothetical protein